VRWPNSKFFRETYLILSPASLGGQFAPQNKNSNVFNQTNSGAMIKFQRHVDFVWRNTFRVGVRACGVVSFFLVHFFMLKVGSIIILGRTVGARRMKGPTRNRRPFLPESPLGSSALDAETKGGHLGVKGRTYTCSRFRHPCNT
jgi:hypothetical protein